MASSTFRALTIVAAVMVLTAGTGAQTNQDKLDISAFAISMGTVATGKNDVVQIRINSWSSPEERKHLIETMIEKNAAALLRELQKTPSHGRFSIPGHTGPDPHQLRLGYDLHYTWQTPQPDGGRRIVIATDRYIGFAEARNQPRTVDYPFTLFEMRFDRGGMGQGKMAYGTQINFDKKKNSIELENYSSEPVRLQNLQIKTKSS